VSERPFESSSRTITASVTIKASENCSFSMTTLPATPQGAFADDNVSVECLNPFVDES
jgi:hypothetical protein